MSSCIYSEGIIIRIGSIIVASLVVARKLPSNSIIGAISAKNKQKATGEV